MVNFHHKSTEMIEIIKIIQILELIKEIHIADNCWKNRFFIKKSVDEWTGGRSSGFKEYLQQ
jgi:hypothetical protein